MKKEKPPIVLPTVGLISIGRLAKYLRIKPEAFYFALPDNTPLTKFGENFENAMINIETFGMKELQTTMGVFKAIALTPDPEKLEPEEKEEDDDSLVGNDDDEEESVEDKLKKLPDTKETFYTAKGRKKTGKGKKNK